MIQLTRTGTLFMTLDTRVHIDTRPRIPNHALGIIAIIPCEQNSIGTIAPEARIVKPTRLPVPHSRTQPMRPPLNHANNVVRPLRLPSCTDRHSRLAQIPSIQGTQLRCRADIRPIRLDNMDRLSMARCQRVQRVLQVGERGAGAVEGGKS
jgi:hypothetical protein